MAFSYIAKRTVVIKSASEESTAYNFLRGPWSDDLYILVCLNVVALSRDSFKNRASFSTRKFLGGSLFRLKVQVRMK
jgi:hypothetical protein